MKNKHAFVIDLKNGENAVEHTRNPHIHHIILQETKNEKLLWRMKSTACKTGDYIISSSLDPV